MQLPIYQVDAFTDRLFGGNPAAVCPLEHWLPDATMQAIAAENNLAETAFFVPEGSDYALRWFTPTVEVDLCGHATLASARVIFERDVGLSSVKFRTLKAGTLRVTRAGDLLAMDFPARPATAIAARADLATALGKAPQETLLARENMNMIMALYAKASDVAALAPDFAALAKLDCPAVIASAPGEDGIDFVSRFFAPALGIPEDPVTGAAHCTLTPYWSKRLGKTRLEARQISARGGSLTCTLAGARVIIAGRTVLYLEGKITV
jgi:PhzF family phenazine biosynthesis protein